MIWGGVATVGGGGESGGRSGGAQGAPPTDGECAGQRPRHRDGPHLSAEGGEGRGGCQFAGGCELTGGCVTVYPRAEVGVNARAEVGVYPRAEVGVKLCIHAQ
eukprot:6048640-Pyramimonas_sp.AAC.1